MGVVCVVVVLPHVTPRDHTLTLSLPPRFHFSFISLAMRPTYLRRPIGMLVPPFPAPQPFTSDVDVNRRVWIPDPTEGFLPGWIKDEPAPGSAGTDDTAEVVVAATGEMRTVPVHTLSPMNPPQFDGVEDIAELTHLNEASVVNDLRLRYGAGSIYVSASCVIASLC